MRTRVNDVEIACLIKRWEILMIIKEDGCQNMIVHLGASNIERYLFKEIIKSINKTYKKKIGENQG